MEFVFTGFQPFLEHDHNPSWDAAQAAANAAGARAYELEVTFDAAATDAAWLVSSDRATVMFGLAAQSRDIRFERFAHNVKTDGPLMESRLEDRADLIRETTWDTGALARAWNTNAARLGLPAAALSRDAGNYVCNALYWHTLGRSGAQNPALFVHIPNVTPAVAAQIGEQVFQILSGAQAVA